MNVLQQRISACSSDLQPIASISCSNTYLRIIYYLHVGNRSVYSVLVPPWQ